MLKNGLDAITQARLCFTPIGPSTNKLAAGDPCEPNCAHSNGIRADQSSIVELLTAFKR